MPKYPFGINPKDPFGLSGKSTGGKRRPIDKNLRNHVWQKYNKNSLSGKCYVCERPITYDTFVVGHNIALAKGGTDRITNLRPLCHGCNTSMGTITIEQYKRRYFGKETKSKSSAKPSKKAKPKRKIKSNDPFGFGDFKPPWE